MAPKKQPPRKKQPRAAADDDSNRNNGLIELTELTDLAKDEPFNQAGIILKAAALVALAAVSANVSELALSPVYGSIPASLLRHNWVIWPAMSIGWAGNIALRQSLPFKPIQLLPLLAIYIPVIQFYMFRMSDRFSADTGAAIAEAVSLGPLVAVSTACVADILEDANVSYLPSFIAKSTPGMASYGLFILVQYDSINRLALLIGQSLALTRIGLQLILATIYAIVGRSKLLLLGVPALLHLFFVNTHFMTPMATNSLNNTLKFYDWSLVDRGESITGYVSVLDNRRDGYRTMRCDHSLLGGEWTKYGKIIVGEPIYSVFVQLEAVRLVEMPDKVPDNQAKALSIGLGIGTTPSALIEHGIDTTIVEIDPLVYDFAQKYFGLPSKHTAVIDDVFHWLAESGAEQEGKYDYIIHDVFTGGAEPIDLFTEEFMLSLKAMLKPNGVIAVNFAADFDLPPLSIVVNTVRSVFPTCRVFRESAAPSAETRAEQDGRDFDNVIIFCTQVEGGAVNFRAPVEADFLKSVSRKSYLLPKHEVPDSAFFQGNDILRSNETLKMQKYHVPGALGHWKVMRTVLPHEIWENW